MANLPPRRKVRMGEVVSNRMDKTVVVKIERKFLHPVFKKFVKKTKKLYAHDADNKCKVGDKVQIVETRPLSKSKRWRVFSILESIKSTRDTA